MTTPLRVAEELDMGKYSGVLTLTCAHQDHEVVAQAPTTPERTAGTAVRTYAYDDDEEEREVLEALEALGIFDPMDIDVLPWSECESQEELSVDMEDAESSDADEVTSSGSCSIGSFSSPSSSSSSSVSTPSSSSSVSTPSSSFSSAYYSSSSWQQHQRFCAWVPQSCMAAAAD
ncbi:hypothetical protein Vretifemale_18980 [Volvox reticuliferus]|uniref:Uncharacterized protein n=1 Tax=Volvox reticuliferus TaxID=1737510 RepID=A0A8J4CWX5_9CHLO|nr:hypothetical protein Vretifemale_18980 [Volvox reticuliferus]